MIIKIHAVWSAQYYQYFVLIQISEKCASMFTNVKKMFSRVILQGLNKFIFGFIDLFKVDLTCTIVHCSLFLDLIIKKNIF